MINGSGTSGPSLPSVPASVVQQPEESMRDPVMSGTFGVAIHLKGVTRNGVWRKRQRDREVSKWVLKHKAQDREVSKVVLKHKAQDRNK